MTAQEINTGLRVLRNFYARDGNPYVLNDVQVSAYLDGLAPFSAAEFEAASRVWMRRSKWFPALSELLEILRGPEVDPAIQAVLAWAAVDAAVRQVGAYRGVQFADPAVGECVLQVFGSWRRACAFDFDSAGWASRRQQFVGLFPTIARRGFACSPTLGGLHRDATPALIPHVEGLETPARLTAADTAPLSRDEARQALAAIGEYAEGGEPRARVRGNDKAKETPA